MAWFFFWRNLRICQREPGRALQGQIPANTVSIATEPLARSNLSALSCLALVSRVRRSQASAPETWRSDPTQMHPLCACQP
eukprot:1796777-Rhodomonas_salina.1